MAYWYDGAALAATGSPVIALFWCLIKFTTTTTTTNAIFSAILKDDNLIWVSKAFKNETTIREIEKSSSVFLQKNVEIEIILFANGSRKIYLY